MYRVVRGGYRRLPGGSDHFSLQTHKQTLNHNIFITIIIIRSSNGTQLYIWEWGSATAWEATLQIALHDPRLASPFGFAHFWIASNNALKCMQTFTNYVPPHLFAIVKKWFFSQKIYLLKKGQKNLGRDKRIWISFRR